MSLVYASAPPLAAALSAGIAPKVRVTTIAARRDTDLASRVRRRDGEAFSDLYREFGATTFGYLVGMLRDRSAAEDVLQEVFLEAWRRGSTYDPARGSLLSWVMTMARSRAIDYLRKRVPEPRDPDAIAVMTDREDPGTSADALLEQWRIAHLIGTLPAEEALVLRMRFYEGLSQTEIAERTGIALGTVKMRMVQALGRLREALEAEAEAA
jgi:RNA polymerase sigma-70 factor (ECF subfamily)